MPLTCTNCIWTFFANSTQHNATPSCELALMLENIYLVQVWHFLKLAIMLLSRYYFEQYYICCMLLLQATMLYNNVNTYITSTQTKRAHCRYLVSQILKHRYCSASTLGWQYMHVLYGCTSWYFHQNTYCQPSVYFSIMQHHPRGLCCIMQPCLQTCLQ